MKFILNKRDENNEIYFNGLMTDYVIVVPSIKHNTTYM